MSTLAQLGPVPGRVGRDIAIITDGGRGSTRDEVVGAVERLRSVGGHVLATPPPPTKATMRVRRSSAPPPPSTQSRLPGFDPPTDASFSTSMPEGP